MTDEEAINALDGFRKAFKTLGPTRAIQAYNTLMTNTRAMTTAFNLGSEFSRALTVIRSVFDAMENKGIRFPSN
jgi:hypothetical protein